MEKNPKYRSRRSLRRQSEFRSEWSEVRRKWLRLYFGLHFLASTDIIVLNYSWLSLSRPRLYRITAYLEVNVWSLPKHENLTTGKNVCGKEEKLLLRSNFSSFPQYFQYISNFKSPITYIFVKCGCSNYFSSILQIWYVEVRISRSIS